VAAADPQAPILVGDVQSRYPDILRAFEEVAVRATSVAHARDLEELLRLVGRRICELLDVNRFSAYLRGDDGLFYGKVGYCRTAHIDDRIKKLVTGTDGFTQEILATRAPVLITDASNDPRTVQRTMRVWHVRDMLGVPLVFSHEVIGIIYVDNEDEEHVYTAEEIQVAQTFASLAALAVRQASLYAQLARRALVVDRQRRLLEQVADAHRRLTAAAARGGDVPGTLRLLSDLVGKPVVFYSPEFEVAAVAAPPGVDPGLVPRGEPARIARMFEAAASAGSATVLAAAPHAGLPYRQFVCPLIVDERPVGHVAVIELGSAIRPLDVKVAEQGATLLALLVLTERRQMEAEGQAREDFLSDLLHGARDAAVLNRRAPLFGVDLQAPHLVVRFALDPDPGLAASARRALVAASLAEALGEAPLIVSVPGADVLLTPLPEGPEGEALRRVRDAVARTIDELRGQVHIRGAAVSKILRLVDEYPNAHRELRAMLEAVGAVAGEEPRVVLATELGVMRLVIAGSAADSRQYAEELLGPLLHYDAETHSELLPTLRRFLECGAQVRATARALAVHENTVRYRLARIAEVSSIDPNDIGSLLNARFALQILDLQGEG
jgi:sugar diacid utilization regulator